MPASGSSGWDWVRGAVALGVLSRGRHRLLIAEHIPVSGFDEQSGFFAPAVALLGGAYLPEVFN
jgi:hypothetical protein